MSKKTHFLSITGFAFLLVCSFACAQESPKAQKSEQTEDQKTALASETSTALSAPSTESESLSKDDLLKVSEAFGNFIGRNLKAPGLNFDLDSIVKGMRAGYNGEPSPLTDQEYEQLMTKVQEQAYKQISTQNLQAANNFLEKNAKVTGVVVVEPGKLQYTITKEGTGAVVQEHFSPQIQYTGKFLDGTTFGSSSETGGPITVPLDQTIPGFSKGILGMKEGEKRIIWVHPDIGYGTSGHLPPNSLLIFEVEAIKANAPEATSDAGDDDLSDLALTDDDNDEDGDEEHDKASEPNKEGKTTPTTPATPTPAPAK